MQSSVPSEPLGLQHRQPVEAALAAMSFGHGENALSDPTFANLYLFRQAHQYRYLPGVLPCVAGLGYDGSSTLLPLFELQDAPLAALRERLQGFDGFYPMAQSQVDALDPSLFAWRSARDDADYLYPAAHFRDYAGRTLGKKRNLVKQLVAAHLVTAKPYSPELIGAATEVLRGWMQDKGKDAGAADEGPCLEALQLAGELGLQGFVHFADGEPAGFVLAQPLGSGVAVMRFAKGLDRFKGIYQHMFQQFCQATPRLQWLNFEQDMGLANFRRSKLSYQPSALLPKYRVSLR